MINFSLIFKILTITALIAVLVLSLRPSVNMGGPVHMDKIVHLGAYGVLAGLARLGWPNLWGGALLLGLAAFGILIEFLQHFMDLGRTGSLADGIANIMGAALALAFFHLFWTRQQR